MKFELNRRNDNYDGEIFDSFLNSFFDKEDVYDNKTEYSTNFKNVFIKAKRGQNDDNPEYFYTDDFLFVAYKNGNFRINARDSMTGRTMIEHYGEIHQSQYYEDSTGERFASFSKGMGANFGTFFPKNLACFFDIDITDDKRGRKQFTFMTDKEEATPRIYSTEMRAILEKYFNLEGDNGMYGRDSTGTDWENDKAWTEDKNRIIHEGFLNSSGYSQTSDSVLTGTEYPWGTNNPWSSSKINLGECVIDASKATIIYNKDKKEEKMKDRFSSFMPAKVKTGEVALTMTGALAVRGKDGNYISYNKKTKQIEDHMDLVFGEGKIEEMCFLMPTDIKQLEVGDIVNSNGAYCYVEGQDKETGKLTLVNFSTSVREESVGSENVFTKMSTVRKLVTAFDMTGSADGNPMVNMLPFMLMSGKDKGGDDSMFKMMMMSQMMGGNMGGDSNGMNPMMMMMFMDKL